MATIYSAGGWRRPDHLVILPVLLALSAAAWLAANGLAGDHMRLGLLTTPAMMNMDTQTHMDMGTSVNGAAIFLFMGTWITMMVAMMFPAVSPVVLTYRRWARSRGASSWGTITFVGGYLAVWSAIGAFLLWDRRRTRPLGADGTGGRPGRGSAGHRSRHLPTHSVQRCLPHAMPFASGPLDALRAFPGRLMGPPAGWDPSRSLLFGVLLESDAGPRLARDDELGLDGGRSDHHLRREGDA